jgi:hypothetical protein
MTTATMPTEEGLPARSFSEFFEHYVSTPLAGVTLCDIQHLSAKLDPFFCQDGDVTKGEFWTRFYSELGRSMGEGKLTAGEKAVVFILPVRKFIGKQSFKMELIAVKLTCPLVTEPMLHQYKVHKFHPEAYLEKHGQIGEELFSVSFLVHWDGTPRHPGYIIAVVPT